MEVLLLGIYSFFVWLIFIKLKWLPWNIGTQVTVVIIPIVGLAALILLLNIYAPSSSDVRVFKYTVPIVSQVRGRVIEVPVEEGNRLVKRGEVLFRVDPTPYQLDVNMLEAQLVNTQAAQRGNPGARLGRAGRVERAPDRAEARRHAEGRIRAGRADPRAARECEMAARPDDHAIAVRLLRGEPAAAPRRLRRRAAGESGDDARGGGRPGGRLL